MKKRQGTKVPTIEQRRIAVIKDAIKQVKQGKYTVLAQNGYVRFTQEFKGQGACELNVQAKPLISGNKLDIDACEVCAKGALLVSQVRRENVLTLKQLENAGARNGRLDALFSKTNLDNVEAYFEGAYFEGSNTTKSFKVQKNAVSPTEFHEQNEDDRGRLLIILENMLANKGKFKPKQLPKEEVEEIFGEEVEAV